MTDSGGLAQTLISVNRDTVANNKRRDDAIEDLIRQLGFEYIFLQVLKARVVNSTRRLQLLTKGRTTDYSANYIDPLKTLYRRETCTEELSKGSWTAVEFNKPALSLSLSLSLSLLDKVSKLIKRKFSTKEGDYFNESISVVDQEGKQHFI